MCMLLGHHGSAGHQDVGGSAVRRVYQGGYTVGVPGWLYRVLPSHLLEETHIQRSGPRKPHGGWSGWDMGRTYWDPEKYLKYKTFRTLVRAQPLPHHSLRSGPLRWAGASPRAKGRD